MLKVKSLKCNPDSARARFTHTIRTLLRSHRIDDFKTLHESMATVQMLAFSPSGNEVFSNPFNLTALRIPFLVYFNNKQSYITSWTKTASRIMDILQIPVSHSNWLAHSLFCTKLYFVLWLMVPPRRQLRLSSTRFPELYPLSFYSFIIRLFGISGILLSAPIYTVGFHTW